MTQYSFAICFAYSLISILQTLNAKYLFKFLAFNYSSFVKLPIISGLHHQRIHHHRNPGRIQKKPIQPQTPDIKHPVQFSHVHHQYLDIFLHHGDAT